MSQHEFEPISDSEEMRRHLVDDHHWPAGAPYDVTVADFQSLHREYHYNPAAGVTRTRQILGMPDEEPQENE
jgi:hypothetical protein